MHIFPADKADIPSWVTNACNWATRFVLECENPSSTFGLADTDNNLNAMLPKPLLDWLINIWPRLGFQYGFESLHPSMVPIRLGQAGLNTVSGIEEYVHQNALHDQKSIEYLETPSDFLDALNSAPIDDVVKSIEFVARNFDTRQLRLSLLHDAWIKLDRIRMWHVVGDTPMANIPSMHEAALLRRNRAWVNKIFELLETNDPTLVVVGALHLCGPQNLEELVGKKLHRLI